MDPNEDRYSRQLCFAPIGRRGQDQLRSATATIFGCGALGASSAEMLARSGVGTLVLVDRDIVEPSNLGRQALYDEHDAARGLPKAVALQGHLSRFNPAIRIEARVTDVNATTIRIALAGSDLVLDGTDNLQARYLLNDWAIETNTPWIYGACVASRGMTAVVLPGDTHCLRCWFPEAPPAGSLETCDTAGIIAPAATLIASVQVAEALKLLVGDRAAVRRSLLTLELWPYRQFELRPGAESPRPACRACGQRDLQDLQGGSAARSFAYCGRNAVQIVPPSAQPGNLDLERLQERLSPHYATSHNGFVLRVTIPEGTLVAFDDGRVLVTGTGDESAARSLYDRYIGG